MELSDKYKGKKLLILGGAAQCSKVVEAAKEMGVYTIVTDINPNGKAYKIADESIPYSVMDAESIISWCEKHPVDGVLNYCIDFAQKSHQIICEHFGFPCYGTKEQYRVMTDKIIFKEYCNKLGVGTIPQYSDEFSEEIEYPVLIKPAESSGSRGTFVCHNKEELLECLPIARSASKNEKAIIEKYMKGKPDFSMTYIVIDRKPYLIRTIDRYCGTIEENLDRQCIVGVCPSKYTREYLESAHKEVTRFIEAIGLENAPLFMQGFVDGGVFRFYDPAIRFTGSEYEYMLKKTTGIDIVKPFVSYALGYGFGGLEKELDRIYEIGSFCGMHIHIDALPGKIDLIEGVEKLKELPYVIVVQQKHKKGYVIPETGDVNHRIIEVVVAVENKPELIQKAIDEIYETVIIQDADGRNMKASKFDVRRMS